jgi:hydroxyethylthiazole kinase-like sugar kinase family protein
MPVPDSCMVTVESIFNTSIVYGAGTKQFRTQKIISSFTVNSSGVVAVLTGSPDILADTNAQSFIGGAQVISGGANTLSFQVGTGNGVTSFSGRSVVSFTATINNYQGH